VDHATQWRSVVGSLFRGPLFRGFEQRSGRCYQIHLFAQRQQLSGQCLADSLCIR
jgi:hypothetical protein